MMRRELTDREKRVLNLRERYTLKQIGEMFGVTPVRIRQIEMKARKKLVCNGGNKIGFLPYRVRTALQKAGIKTIEEAKSKSDVELLTIRGVGKIGFENIRDW